MGRALSVSVERPKAIKPKKDYKAIQRLRLEAKNKFRFVFTAPLSQPAGAQAWEKRKGRGPPNRGKKKPGGVNKKFKYAR